MQELQSTVYRDVLERLPDAVLLADDQRRYVDCNSAAASLLGVPRELILQMRVEDVAAVPEAFVSAMWRDFLTRGTMEGEIVLHRGEAGAVHAVFQARANVAPGLHLSLLRALPDDHARDAELLLRLGDVLRMQTHVATQELSLDDVMSAICERAAALCGGEAAAIELADGDALVCRAASGTLGELVGTRTPKWGSLSGLALDGEQTLRCDDTESDVRVARDACRRVGVRSLIVMSLAHDAGVAGVLKVASPRAHAFDHMKVELLRLVAALLGAAMARAQAADARAALQRAQHDRVCELEQLRDELAPLLDRDIGPASAFRAAHQLDERLRALLDGARRARS